MRHVTLPRIGTYAAWRDEARALAQAGVPPEDVTWSRGEAAPSLFPDERPQSGAARPLTVPKSFLYLSRSVAAHSDPERFALLYRALIACQARPAYLADRADPVVHRLRQLEKSVHRDQHKMKAFLRFREDPSCLPLHGTTPGKFSAAEPLRRVGAEGGDTPRRAFVAWFEPEHFILENLADFFRNRFASMDFLIVTPDMSMRFENGATTFALDTPRPPDLEDGTEELWKTYFANIFNPARLKVSAMLSEMPKKYWKNMPEAELIPGLVADARSRETAMRLAAPSVPHARTETWRTDIETLEDLRAAASGCDRCPLAGPATQLVFGEGPSGADLMIVGEQPGDHEDLEGRPFVGPAGQLFDRVAGEVGLDRNNAYVTNAVKHFKYIQRGKRRIHQRPDAGQVSHCRWWLEREIAVVQPKLILAMGATALQSLTGNGKGILSRRGRIEDTRPGPPALITVHPSYLLRIPDDAARVAAESSFRADLTMAVRIVNDLAA